MLLYIDSHFIKKCIAFISSYKCLISLLFLALTVFNSGNAQTTIVTDSSTIQGTTVIIAGKKFERSKWHNLFWGSHYRKEWSTPVRVKNFYLDTAKGGLKVIKEGGSRQ